MPVLILDVFIERNRDEGALEREETEVNLLVSSSSFWFLNSNEQTRDTANASNRWKANNELIFRETRTDFGSFSSQTSSMLMFMFASR